MRILNLDLDFEQWPVLQDKYGVSGRLSMQRLGQVVLLAGENGAGKTRTLKAIAAVGASHEFAQSEREYLNQIANVQSAIAEKDEAIKRQETRASNESKPSSITEVHRRAKAELVSEMARLHERLQVRESIVTWPPSGLLRPVFFTPPTPNLQDARVATDKQIEARRQAWAHLGVSNASENVPSHIKDVLRAAVFAQVEKLHGRATESDEKLIQDAEALKAIIRDLLGDRSAPSVDRSGNVQLYGTSDYHERLSAGQKVLLVLAAALHAQGAKLKDALLFLDEPENHLHPKVLGHVVRTLMEKVTEGQIWIATHSVPLIAQIVHEDPASLWYVDDGKVSHAGKRPERVLAGLLGGEEEIAKLRDFTDLPSKLAANRYAADCLVAPRTVAPREGDEQQNQMTRVLHGLVKPGEKLRVLDFGAGQGRLLAALQDASMDAASMFDYFAFDLAGADGQLRPDNQLCIRAIENVYGERAGRSRFFTRLSDLAAQRPGGVDVVVMCNVLHEIAPEEWLSTIGRDSELARLVREGGYLLVVEDQRVPVGEHAHDYGFLVLDSPQFNRLFQVTEADLEAGKYIIDDARRDIPSQKGRLKAHLFARDIFTRISAETRQLAIEDLSRSAAVEMKRLREPHSPRTFPNGQLHGFWMAQFANAALWLRNNGTSDQQRR